MKRNLTTLFIFVLFIGSALCQNPIITMATAKKTGTSFSFLLRANVNTKVNVDFGNGTLQEFAVGSTDNTTISGVLSGSSVKVYGSASEITILVCINNILTSLDVTNNTALIFLACQNNQLTTLNVAKNIALLSLHCENNRLTTLDVSKNVSLSTFNCQDNQFTFATLPLEQTGWTYLYAPQNDVSIAKDFKTGDEIDLSAQLMANGKISVYTWKTKNGTTLAEGTDYTIAAGKTIFKNAFTDSVYCEMKNTSFPSFSGSNVLKTTKIKIRQGISGPPIITMTTTKGIGNSISFYLRANTETFVTVDFGNGATQDFAVTSNAISLIEGNLTGSTVKIYGSAAEIKYLYCNSCNINNLDVSKAIALYWLDCHDNQLATLDVSLNAELQYLDCEKNKLTTLSLKKNISMSMLRCNNNQLTIATLPIKEAFWGAYYYAPQQSIPIAKSFNTGDMLDLSTQLSAGGNTTSYNWKTKSGAALTLGTDYAITAGKIIFLKVPPDSVYCEMTNATFPDFKNADVLKTTNTKITGASISVITMTTGKNVGSAFSFILQTNANNTPVKVDFGNGTLVANTVGTIESTVSGNLTGSQTIRIYGTGMVYLDCSNNQLSALDVSKNTALTGLDCYGNQLTTIDISKNIALESFSCDNNLLTELDVTKNTALTLIYCSNNRLSTLNLINNTELISLNCSYNQLPALDVTKNTKLTSYTCNNNKLSVLDVSKNNALFRLICNNNQLTFSTLPIRTMQEYRYAPQQPISIAKNFNTGDIADLSAQLLAGGNTTVYTLKTRSGTNLVNGTDYSITSGKISFLKAQIDSVYCEMTNATFPYFTGSDVLKTSCTKLLEAGKQIQSINFDPLPNKNVNDAPFTITASASSGLPITFTSSDQTVASITSNIVHIHNAGTTIITATQIGDDNWNSAMAEQTLIITPTTGINEADDQKLIVFPNPVASVLYIKGEDIGNASVSILTQTGTIVWSGIVKQQSINISELPSGFYILKISSKNKGCRTIRFLKQ